MSEKLTVLVVENDLDTAETLSALLSMWGHDAIVTRDVVAASRAMARRLPDVIIGTGHVATLRADCQGLKKPFVIAIDADRRLLDPSRVDLAILKPADPEFLFNLLGRFKQMLSKGANSKLGRPSAAMLAASPVTVACLPA
jgi:CheY-like chemotaxis protein